MYNHLLASKARKSPTRLVFKTLSLQWNFTKIFTTFQAKVTNIYEIIKQTNTRSIRETDWCTGGTKTKILFITLFLFNWLGEETAWPMGIKAVSLTYFNMKVLIFYFNKYKKVSKKNSGISMQKKDQNKWWHPTQYTTPSLIHFDVLPVNIPTS